MVLSTFLTTYLLSKLVLGTNGFLQARRTTTGLPDGFRIMKANSSLWDQATTTGSGGVKALLVITVSRTNVGLSSIQQDGSLAYRRSQTTTEKSGSLLSALGSSRS